MSDDAVRPAATMARALDAEDGLHALPSVAGRPICDPESTAIYRIFRNVNLYRPPVVSQFDQTETRPVRHVPWRRCFSARSCEAAGALLKGWAVSKFEIELVLKDKLTVIGEADDAERALNLFDEAIRQYPSRHIRIRCGTKIVSERMPPRKPQ